MRPSLQTGLILGLAGLLACAPSQGMAGPEKADVPAAQSVVFEGASYTRLDDRQLKTDIAGHSFSPDPSGGRSTTSIWKFFRNGKVLVVGHQEIFDGRFEIKNSSINATFPEFESKLYFYRSSFGSYLMGSVQDGQLSLRKQIIESIPD